MEPLAAARMLAFGRVAVGAALIVAPEKVLAPWLGRDGATAGSRVIGAAMGARDIAIGAGQLLALSRGRGASDWIRAGAAADVVDLVATVRARDSLPALGVAGVGLMATTGAVAGAWLQSAVD